MPKSIPISPSARCAFSLASIALAALALLAWASMARPAQAAGEVGAGAPLAAWSEDAGGQAIPLAFSPAITMTKAYTLSSDLDGDGLADPGDVLTYTLVVRNPGPAALGAVLTDALDVNTALLGDWKATPLAINDAYSATGNVPISLTAAAGLLANDRDIDGGTLAALQRSNAATTQGGVVTVTADGGFLYVPPTGFTGTDTFTYTLRDDEGDFDGATVQVGVSAMLWFINNGVGAGGDGSLGRPFNTLAAFDAVNDSTGRHPGAAQTVFVHTGTGAYPGGLTLENDQKLIGQGATGSLPALAGLTLAPNSLPLPALGGMPPTLGNGGAGGVVLARNNTLRGFQMGAVADFAIRENAGAFVDGVTISQVSVNNTAGGALRIAGGGTLTATFPMLSSNGNGGVSLTNCAGRVTADTGALSVTAGAAVYLRQGTATFLYSGTVTSNAGARTVQVENRTGGEVLLAGAVTDNGLGVLIQNNTNSGSVSFTGRKSLNTGANQAVKLAGNQINWTISFLNGGLNITTTTATAFEATSGTVVVGGAGNSISNTTGSALYVSNGAIGAAGLTFASIRSGGGGGQGIYLNNTGSLGGLTVTGSGGTCSSATSCTGGAIQNKTVDAVYLANTVNPSLTRMYVANNAGNGVSGLNVNGFILDESYLENNGDAEAECGVRFGNDTTNGLIGSAAAGANPTRIRNTTIRGSAEFNLYVANNSNSTLTELYLKDSAFRDTVGKPFGGDGVLIETRNSATAGLRAEGCTFASNDTQGLQGSAVDSSNLTVRVFGSTFTDNYQGVVLENGDTADVTFEIGASGLGNTFSGHDGAVIAVNNATTALAGAVYSGKLNYNTINGDAVADDRAVSAALAGFGSVTLQVDHNTLNNIANFEGIWVQNGENTGDGVSGAVSITNNAVNMAASGRDGIRVLGRQTGALCANITGNTANAGTGAWPYYGIYVRQRDTSTFRLPGYGGTAYDTTAVRTFLVGNNPGAASILAQTDSTGTGFVGGAACALP